MKKLSTDEIVRSITDLPTLPQVATRLVEIIGDPASCARDVTKVMTQDPPLAAKILKLVNSAYFGLPNKVTSLNQGVTLLGFSMIKGMALSVTIFKMFQGAGKDLFSERESFWSHSMTCAGVARAFCVREPSIDPETAFVLGLLHDIGKVILDNYANDAWREIIFTMRAEKLPFSEAEKEVLEHGHAHLGAWLVTKWGLKEELAEGIGGHHEPERLYASRMFTWFHLANRLTRQVAEGLDPAQDPLVQTALGHLGLDGAALPGLLQVVQEELERTASFLSAIRAGV